MGDSGVRSPMITLSKTYNIPSFNVYYNGGGHFYFTWEQHAKHWNILAKYSQNNLNAIIYGQFGKGNVILTGVHPEFDPAVITKSNSEMIKYSQKHPQILNTTKNNKCRLELMTTILSLFNIPIQKSKL